MKIHPTAIIGKKSDIDTSVTVGPYVIIEDGVTIEKNVTVYPHAYICKGTHIGEGTEVHMGAVLGHLPQDVAFKGKDTFVKIGKKNIIREYVTIHRGTNEGSSTVLGDENFIMGLSHIGHNCVIGSRIVLANGALLAGHVTVGDNVFVSGNVVVHQFCNLGRLAMIGGFSGVNKDVPPFLTVRGPSRVRSVNLVGLRRAGFKRDTIEEIQKAFRKIYKMGLNTRQAIDDITAEKQVPEVTELVEFIKASKRGICKDTLARDDEVFYEMDE